jgi:hypothetical protein
VGVGRSAGEDLGEGLETELLAVFADGLVEAVGEEHDGVAWLDGHGNVGEGRDGLDAQWQ